MTSTSTEGRRLDPDGEGTAPELADKAAKYVNELEAPALLAEVRCTVGRLIAALAQEHGPGHPFVVTTVLLAKAVSRFDLASEEQDGDSKPAGHKCLPMAVRASDACACDTADGGLHGRIRHMHDLTHQLMHAQEGGR